MNILLMSMPDISCGYPNDLITPPNLGLASIAGNLDKKHTVKIADLVLKRKNVKRAVVEAIRKTKPDVVGLSAMSFQYNTSVRIAKFIKILNPHIKIALGGYHATSMYKEIADSKDAEYFDFIFRGESDLSFNEAMNQLENGGDLKTVDGLSFKENGRFIHNKKRELEDLDRIESPNRSARLWRGYHVFKVPFDVAEFSRGCLMSCNFCNIRSMYGKSFRTYKIQRVMRDLENAKRSGTRMILFSDDNITLDVHKFEHLCEEIIKNGHNDLIYGVQVSSIGISSSESLVKKMAEAGFKYVFLGIENASKKNLKVLDKGDIINKSKKAVKLLKENHILVAGGFIIGNPDDDYESIEGTYKFAYDLAVDFIAIQLLVPYPKTLIREKLLESGLLINRDNYEQYNGAFCNIRTKYLNDEQLMSIKFKLRKKYFKTRKGNSFKAIMKNKRLSLRLFNRIIMILPVLVGFMLFEKIKKLFLTEDQIFKKYVQGLSNLNNFNI
ncbi:MAG: cobalamin-dependent protein [Candidatus Aminicenantes bacterium]|nr:MAG: cobalamin-dependent protein [Candidatus Aminicenantes bacterium]